MHVKGMHVKATDFTLRRATLLVPPSGSMGNRCTGQSGYPSHLVEALTLRDGTPLTIRPICSDDYQLELDFIEGLSARSSYLRLLSPRKLTSQEVQRFVRIDYARELALIALAVVDNKVRQVGVARYAPESDSPSCDLAIVVADEWQRRGLGEALLVSLVRAAAKAGVQELTGLTLADNVAMRGLARRLGFRIERDPHDATVVQLRMPLSVDQGAGHRSLPPAPIGATLARTGAHNAFSFALGQDGFRVGRWDNAGIRARVK
jgi:GNAT superfamily N-acetyltransferase